MSPWYSATARLLLSNRYKNMWSSDVFNIPANVRTVWLLQRRETIQTEAHQVADETIHTHTYIIFIVWICLKMFYPYNKVRAISLHISVYIAVWLCKTLKYVLRASRTHTQANRTCADRGVLLKYTSREMCGLHLHTYVYIL